MQSTTKTSYQKFVLALLYLAFMMGVFPNTLSAQDFRNREALSSGFSGLGFGGGGWGWGDGLGSNAGAGNFGGNDFGNSQGVTPTYRLGVYVDSREWGQMVTQIQPGSPAARAGINIGDTIITVGGYQVGYLDGRLYDVGDELQRRVDPNGRVTMLVQRQRGQIEPVMVAMQSSSIRLNGEVVTRERMALPQNSRLVVKLANASRSFADINGGTYQAQVYNAPPIPFELQVDPQYLYPGDRYQIQAVILSPNQQVLYQSQPQPIDPTRNPGVVRLEVMGNAGFTGGQSPYTSSYGSADTINQYYNRFLRRQPNSGELDAWQRHVGSGRPLDDLPVTLLSSPEFYDRISGGNTQLFIDQAFRSILGRSPQNNELSEWQRVFDNTRGGNRTAVVRQLFSALQRR
jgi:uncharacterized lipoprotein YbaY